MNYAYNTRGRLQEVKSGSMADERIMTVAYAAFGYITQLNLVPNAPQEVFKQSFVRDKLGRITGKTEVVNGITTTYGYGYDLAGRLATVRENGALVRTYGFDSNSNRISLASAGGTLTGTADAQDRLLSYGPNAYSYAPNGEPTTRTKANSTRNFNYDEMGNLTALSEGSLQLNYQFDAQGRRIQRSKNGQLTHRWLYLDQLRIAAELNADGSLKQQFAYGEKINVPSLILRKGQNQTEAYRIFSDHLGSVRLVVKVSDRAIVQRMRYDEYRQVLEDTNPGFQPFGYAGELYDPDSGLVRFGARDYDAETGRWLAKDPIGFGGGANFYQYALSDPVSFLDITGNSVIASYSQSDGWLIVLDLDPNGGTPIQQLGLQAESGGKPFGDPIPIGNYDILEQGARPDFFRLEPNDSSYGDDTHDASGRDVFRLHKPGRTLGCIAAKNENDWAELDRVLNGTKRDFKTVKSKSRNPFSREKTEELFFFGNLRVVK